MFFGIIKHKGILKDKIVTSDGYQFVIEVDDIKLFQKVRKFIAINGCRLAVVKISENKIVVDVPEEISDKTNLGTLKQNMSVNCEAPVSPPEKFKNYFVLGEIHAIGKIEEIKELPDSHQMTISFPEEFKSYLIMRDLITIDGVNLNTTELKDDSFSVRVNPLIWEKTNFTDKQCGDTVNIEFDSFSTFVVSFLETDDKEYDSISED
ncbi:MAG: riboflavin synthase [Ignavibacteriaceae bacterium]|jgi:riboflavin synthase|nr:riboflavin synthase [Ignavibacteriaceae bacterium]